ncbi:uncharacterized protein ACIB01_007472 [Guaruba guarouba]
MEREWEGRGGFVATTGESSLVSSRWLLFFFPVHFPPPPPLLKEENLKKKKNTFWIFSPPPLPSPPPLAVASCLACGVTVMKKCFWEPGRAIFLCNESGFCQRKEPAPSEDRGAASRPAREPAAEGHPLRSSGALLASPGARPLALTSVKFKGADSGLGSNHGVVAVADYHVPTKAIQTRNMLTAQQIQT